MGVLGLKLGGQPSVSCAESFPHTGEDIFFLLTLATQVIFVWEFILPQMVLIFWGENCITAGLAWLYLVKLPEKESIESR